MQLYIAFSKETETVKKLEIILKLNEFSFFELFGVILHYKVRAYTIFNLEY
jgi:hypothetical protein